MKLNMKKISGLLLASTLMVSGLYTPVLAAQLELPEEKELVLSEEPSLEDEEPIMNATDSVDEGAVLQETVSDAAPDTMQKLTKPTAEWVKEKKQITYTSKWGDGAEFEKTETVCPGEIIITRTEDGTNEYSINVYKTDGTKVHSAHIREGVQNKSTKFIRSDLLIQYLETGDYYFTIYALGDGKTSVDSDVFTSDTWHFVTTGKCLPTPEKPTANTEYRSFLFSLPEDAHGYSVTEYFRRNLSDQPIGYRVYYILKVVQ